MNNPLHPDQDSQRPQGEPIQCAPNAGFIEWLANSKGSLVVSTYQAGKLLMIGWDGQQLTLLMRHYDKPMGFDVSGKKLALATRNNITIHANDPVRLSITTPLLACAKFARVIFLVVCRCSRSTKNYCGALRW